MRGIRGLPIRPARWTALVPTRLLACGLSVGLGLVLGLAPVAASTAWAAPGDRAAEEALDEWAATLREVEQSLAKAEQAAKREPEASADELAKRLVRGQLQLAEGDYQGAAIAFLDIVENHPSSQASIEATFYLGEAIMRLGMDQWSFELFIKVLGDARSDAKRLKPLAVARLLDLAVPRREPGFARKPGLSATPEMRARLRAVGLSTTVEPPKGKLRDADIERLVRWAESLLTKDGYELSYAYGRHLYLTGKHDRAIAVLDAMSPVDIPITRGGQGAKWRVRAAYVAAAAALALDDVPAALDRFSRITKARPSDPNDRQIVELAWLGIARIHHDEGNTEDAVKSYRRIGRDSPYFPEAMYETAWTLMAAQQYEQAVQALDLLLVYDPDSPIAAEIKHLRGKVRIQQRDYEGAEAQFLVLRREFERLAKRLGGKLQSKGDATAYFAAVVGEDMEHFSLGSLLPTGALPLAHALPRAMHGESLAGEVGQLDRELEDLRSLLRRMEEAVDVPHKAKLFNDLAAHVAGLDDGTSQVLEVQEQLVARQMVRARGEGVDRLESERRKLRAKLDAPVGGAAPGRDKAGRAIERLEQQAHKLELVVAELRAQLVATERYYEETRAEQKIDHQAFLTQAAEMRDEIAGLEAEAADLRRRVSRARANLRFSNPEDDAWRQAAAAYQQHLSRMHQAFAKVAAEAEADALWKRAESWHAKAGVVRAGLDAAAERRLAKAMIIMAEERANLDQYRSELDATRNRTKDLVSEVMSATYRDVVGELHNQVMRSEVGLLDVAWAMKESESDEVKRLEYERDRTLGDLDAAVKMGLEELGQ
ncbi:tetratricopeptide repeat protein [Paraliomyxa miuraensis]|uniref:tetratricopeptide repeat protein n=1 Tax=Paraliomyxa miuraensis TaxID=376150 RepID=UPI0022552AF2|nr:tetratricopeptide repeat protein [Paraliomyxa miuraensis]MCX4239520.1 tetratricopeptide repeat protein [Paraliomyxa miuraensis]